MANIRFVATGVVNGHFSNHSAARSTVGPIIKPHHLKILLHLSRHQRHLPLFPESIISIFPETLSSAGVVDCRTHVVDQSTSLVDCLSLYLQSCFSSIRKWILAPCHLAINVYQWTFFVQKRFTSCSFLLCVSLLRLHVFLPTCLLFGPRSKLNHVGCQVQIAHSFSDIAPRPALNATS